MERLNIGLDWIGVWSLNDELDDGFESGKAAPFYIFSLQVSSERIFTVSPLNALSEGFVSQLLR